ncbi:zinc-finger domain-containing protein [Glaciimonas sp. PCH181]|uniref:zinc-finger domain-containing protein n=1 Tax=Glaciimonas sp. PCH181 TaxID=2133943 RepID=UPI000D38E283|nr:zinc-finger domain-containing protein [Glaciimonas sp. PCH181]PUA17362.1 zinc-finger domain-containing protein [Glaciimonas sp. PCH181]
MSTATSATNPQAAVELDGKDLPAHCPNPLMPIWSSHPRVFLDLTKTGHAKCPYCGTEYCMKPGAVIKAH